MKTSKLPTQLAKNASKLHKHVLSLIEEIYPTHIIRQEYNVSKVNPDFESNREKYDIVVFGGGIKLVIECHGIQHEKPICFGGITLDQAKKNFIKRQDVDYKKEQAAREAGWIYIVVWHYEKDIDKEDLEKKIFDAAVKTMHDKRKPKEFKEKPKVKIQSKGFDKGTPKQKIQSRGFQKHEGKYKWPKRKLNQKK